MDLLDCGFVVPQPFNPIICCKVVCRLHSASIAEDFAVFFDVCFELSSYSQKGSSPRVCLNTHVLVLLSVVSGLIDL